MQEIQETLAQSLGWEDPLEKEMATHSGFLAWRIPWPAEPGRLQSIGLQRVGHNWECTHTHTHTLISYVEYLFMCLLAIKYLVLYSSCNFEMITLRFESTDYILQEILQIFFNCFWTKLARLSFGAYMTCKYYLRVKLWSLKILQHLF